MSYKLIEITLEPLTPFFFGMEPFHHLGNKADYFQRSFDYPQQTTLLGLLRHKILRDNGIDLNEANPVEKLGISASALIGEKSFELNNNSRNDFGKIHSISPVYIIDHEGKRMFFEMAENIDGKPLTLALEEESFICNERPYTSKSPFDLKIGDVKKDEILHPTQKIGIYKGGVKTTSTDESFFIMEYKQLGIKTNVLKEFHRFKAWKFAFQAIVCTSANILVGHDVMTMGKEQSLFKVSIRDMPAPALKNSNDYPTDDTNVFNLVELCAPTSEIVKCVLLSDARLANEKLKELEKLCRLQITQPQRMRYIKRQTGQYYIGKQPIKEIKAFNLLSKGSVLYCKLKDKDEVKGILEQTQDFRQIGYNYFYFKNA